MTGKFVEGIRKVNKGDDVMETGPQLDKLTRIYLNANIRKKKFQRGRIANRVARAKEGR